jgi:hypothetical protein
MHFAETGKSRSVRELQRLREGEGSDDCNRLLGFVLVFLTTAVAACRRIGGRIQVVFRVEVNLSAGENVSAGGLEVVRVVWKKTIDKVI